MFEFATASRIIFGKNALDQALPALKTLGNKALVVLGLGEQWSAPLLQKIEDQGIQTIACRAKGEPTLATVQTAVHLAHSQQVDMVISIGGGSALDTGKAVAVLLTNPGEITDYLEIVGKNQPLTRPGKPFIAIPTTSGTGSEVTKNAVIEIPEKRIKVSLRSPLMLACMAIVDPVLTLSLSPSATAASGLDALTQVIEPFLSSKGNPLADSLCREGIQRAGRSLRTACLEGDNHQAREDMALTSLFGGLALANAGLGAVHGFAAPIGGMFHVPHGVICGRLLPAVMEVNFKHAMTHPNHETLLQKFHEIASLLCGQASATPQQAIQWIEESVNLFGIPRLKELGINRHDFHSILEKAGQANSMKANPILLSAEEMTEILEKAS